MSLFIERYFYKKFRVRVIFIKDIVKSN